jgi:murein DD-endopeptidase MepM/ murein hydrolase activator NlpD
MQKRWPLALLFPLLCLCLVALALMQNANGDFPLLARGTPHPEYGTGPGGGIPPGGGSCDNIGQENPKNPFGGWPAAFWPGNWNIISSWYCDPNYFKGYTHWGIDLARLDWSRDPTHAIDGAPALVTAERVIVRQAIGCPPANPCWNFGMGNFVQVEALEPHEECIPVPDKDPVCEIIWVPSGWKATYMHLLDVSVQVSETLERWGVLGHIDNSGNSTGPHLHYQINDPDGKPIDPAPSMANSYTDELRTIWKEKR